MWLLLIGGGVRGVAVLVGVFLGGREWVAVVYGLCGLAAAVLIVCGCGCYVVWGVAHGFIGLVGDWVWVVLGIHWEGHAARMLILIDWIFEERRL